MLVLTVHPPDISQRLAELVLRGVQATSTPLAVLWMAGGDERAVDRLAA